MNTIIQITASHVAIVIISLGIIQFLLANWIKIRLEKSIHHEYSKKLEDYKFSQLQRQKAEIIAKLLAKWIKFRGQERKILNKGELIDYYEELNRMSFEISLWIPDEKLLTDIMDRLANKENAKDPRELVGRFRELILGYDNKELDVQNIVLWPTDDIASELFEVNKKEKIDNV